MISKNKQNSISLCGDKYKDAFFVKKYVALWAYGYLNNLGQSEGLYRTINELGFSSLDKNAEHKILDIGCGVGRTSADYAKFFENSEVIGIDGASLMVEMARRINKSNEKIDLDMSSLGFDCMSINGQIIENVNFQESMLVDFYSDQLKNSFDLVVSVNFIDRVANIEQSFKIVSNILKLGGTFILATPLNFSISQSWGKCGSLDLLSKLVQKFGFVIEVKFDGLVYKEVLDARGASEEYPTVVMKLIKTK